jgi:hypothetical protein
LLNSGAPVESGKEWVMQVHYDEGVANRIGPEPCVGIREDDGEASAGERMGIGYIVVGTPVRDSAP